VVAIRDHGPRAPEPPVHGLREADPEGLHPAPEGLAIRGLDDGVEVVALDRVVDEPEALPPAHPAEGVLDRAHDGDRAKRCDSGAHPERHEAGEPRCEALAGQVGHAPVRQPGSPGVRPSPTPVTAMEGKLFLQEFSRPSHELNIAVIQKCVNSKAD